MEPEKAREFRVIPIVARSRVFLAGIALLASATLGFAQDRPDDPALQHSIEQLRSSIGTWVVQTEFLKPDGSVARSVEGTYEFSWVVPDRVVSGRSEIPEMKQVAGLLFYVNAARRKIEMVSVAGDGNLWIMSGALGEEVRTSQDFKTTGGGIGRLRFTRFNVSEDAFESRMEYTEDGGQSWTPGNHQRFRKLSRAAK